MNEEYTGLTPTWKEVLPVWLMMYREAITGNCDNPEQVRNGAEAELRRMAEAADKWVAHCKEQK